MNTIEEINDIVEDMEKPGILRSKSGYKGAYVAFKIITAPESTHTKDSESTQTIMDVEHVYVPSRLRGRGIAEIFVKRVYEIAKQKGYLIKPSCTYVKNTFLPRHSELMDYTVGTDELLHNELKVSNDNQVRKKRRICGDAKKL